MLSPVKMFLSSRQAGYSNRQQRPKLQGPPALACYGGSGGMLPQKILKIFVSNGCIWCIWHHKKKFRNLWSPCPNGSFGRHLVCTYKNRDRWPSIRLTFPRHEYTMFKAFLQNRLCAAQVYVMYFLVTIWTRSLEETLSPEKRWRLAVCKRSD